MLFDAFVGDDQSNPWLISGFGWWWPTHLKNMRKSNWIISLSRGEILKNMKPPPSFRWWFGILGMPSNNPFHKGIVGIQTTNPNHQLTIS